MDLADPRVDACIAACEAGLKRLLRTSRAEVFLYAANGHGAWEATIANLLAPGQAVLVAGTGHFSDSWALQAQAMGARVVGTPYVDGRPIDPAAVEQVLRDDTAREIVAVFVVHTDTASGVTNDLSAIRDAIDRAGHTALFVVDVVASLAAAPFDMDGLRINVAVGASQKGLMVPPGLSFVAADDQAQRVAQSNPHPRFYWDWSRRRSELSYRKFCGTPPQSLLMGLEAALQLLFLEGVDAVLARHRRVADAVHAAVACWAQSPGLSFFAIEPASRSVSVTTIRVGPGIDPDALRLVARERFQVAIAGGLGALTGQAFRIGHLGDMNPAMILGCLAGVEAAMLHQGIAFGQGGTARAVAVVGGRG